MEMQRTSEELALCHSAVERKIKTWTKEASRVCKCQFTAMGHVTVM